MENLDKEITFNEGENQNGAVENAISDIPPVVQVSIPDVIGSEEHSEKALVETGILFELNRVFTAIDSLAKDFQALQQGFDSKIKYDKSKENIVDSLHRELQTYRDGLHFQILRPIFTDLISMYDDLSNLLKYNKPVEGENETVSKLRQSLVSFQETIESTLESHGVTVIIVEGDQFNPQKQRVVRTELTDDPLKDRLICEHIRKGFEYDGRVLRPESVVLYKFIENATPTQK